MSMLGGTNTRLSGSGVKFDLRVTGYCSRTRCAWNAWTCDTFQSPMYSLNSRYPMNRPDMLVTDDTSHDPIGATSDGS